MSNDNSHREHCAFCRKTLAETRLIAGEEASICPECVRLVCDILGWRVVEEQPSEIEQDED